MSEVMPPYRMPEVYNGPNEWFVEYYYWSLSQLRYRRKKLRTGQRGLTYEQRQALLEEVAKELRAELIERIGAKNIMMRPQRPRASAHHAVW